MLVTVVHTDFRLYWPARLRALRRFLADRSAQFEVIEISGKGSPYAFAGPRSIQEGDGWRCLFPEEAMETISPHRASRAVQDALDSSQPDVVIAGAIAFPSGASALRWARVRRRGVVIMDDARRTDVPRGLVTNWVKRRMYSNVDAMLLPAPSHVPDYESWGIPRHKMFFGVCVVDNDFFASRARGALSEHGSPGTDPGLPPCFLLGVGRQIPVKNWRRLVEAWEMFKTKKPESFLKLVFVGNGRDRTDLEAIARSKGRADVVFHDFVSQEKLTSYYAKAAGLVLPSYSETWGLVVNEAMAAGLPVLVSRQCGCAQTLVEPGRNGLVFDAEIVDSICEALVRFDELGDQASQWRERSRTIIQQWGLERFCQGAWAAISHAHNSPKRRPPVLDRLLLRLWKGRYRPT